MKKCVCLAIIIVISMCCCTALAENKLFTFPNSGIVDIAGKKDMLYMLTEDGDLYSYQIGNQEPELVGTGYSSENYGGMALIEDNLYILDKSTETFVKLLEQNSLHDLNGLHLPIVKTITNGEEIWFPFYMQNTEYGLFWLMNIGYSDEAVLCRYDWRTNKLSHIKVKALHAYCVIDDNTLFIVQRDMEGRKLSSLKWSEGKSVSLTMLPQGANGFMYTNDELLFSVGTQVMKMNASLDIETVMNMPIACDSRIGATLLDGEMLVAAFSRQVSIRSLTQGATSATLRVLNDDAQTPGYTKFTNMFPDVEVEFAYLEDYPDTAELSRMILTNELEYDVFRIRSSDFDLETLARKGYLEDLTGDTLLLEAVLSMYPNLVNAAMYNDRLYAVPCRVSGELTMYYKENWERSGRNETDAPDSFYAFLDFILQWSDDDSRIGNDSYIPFDLEPRAAHEFLLKKFFKQYIALYASQNESIAFDTPMFRSYLQKCQEAAKHFEGIRGSGYLLYEFSNRQIISSSTLLLPLSQDNSPVAIVQAEFYVINPMSTNKDVALKYIESCVASYANAERLQLYPTAHEPVINSWYVKELAEWEHREAELVKRLEASDDVAVSRDLQAQLNTLRETKDDNLPSQYDISAEDVSFYHQYIAPHIFIPNARMMSLVVYDDFVFETAITRYLSGNLSMDQFIQELEKVTRMIEVENEY